MNLDMSTIPFFGWVVILILGAMLVLLMCCLLFFLNKISKNHTIKTSFFEVTAKEQQKDLFMAEGKDQLDNQCQIAKQILKEIRVMLYECMVRKFNVTDKKNIAIIELITYRIVDRLNYEVKNDLTRNHITKKTNQELEQYTRAKARAYYSLIKDRLYMCNAYLQEYDLPGIMEDINLNTIETIFKDIYYAARRIAGGKNDD